MQRPIFILIIFAVALLLSSCKDEITGGNNNGLLKGKSSAGFTGTWILKNYEDSSIVMKRSDSLAGDNYGFIFKPGGKFLERKINGWCATPPVVYANYEGTWTVESDSTIKISVGYWGGITEYNMIVTELDENEMRYYIAVNK